jgi:WD40 repeat protein
MRDSPYPGLRPFGCDEYDIFCGREGQTDQLLEKLAKEHFLAILGPSGCGKSSLVRAGLLTNLHGGMVHGASWWITELRPGNSPFANLASALLKKDDEITTNNPTLASYKSSFTHSLSSSLQEENLHGNSQNLCKILAENPLPEYHNLLILVDQFEELFRYSQEGGTKEVMAFVALLLESCKHDRVYVLITMRSEFLDKCTQFKELPEKINQGLFLVPNLNRDQSRQAIELPAKVFASKLEPELVECLLDDMGDDPDQLPLMQHVLMRMWWHLKGAKGVTLSLGYYEEIGGLAKALSKSAEEEAYGDLAPEKQKIAEILFRCLSEYNEKENNYVRRPVNLGDVAQLANKDWLAIVEIIDEFRKRRRRFLTPSLENVELLNEHSIIDISHESLIRQWQRLKDWAKEETEWAKSYRHLEENACAWKQGEAALLRTPGLEHALEWYDAVQKLYTEPTQMATWASRYGEHFDSVNVFLNASKKAQKEEKKKSEQAKHKELALKLASLGLVIAISLGSWGLWERSKAVQLQQERTSDLFNSKLTHAALLARDEDYAAAKTNLSEISHLDSEIAAPPRHARNLLAWFSKLMDGAPQQVYKGAKAALYATAINSNGNLLAAAGEKGTVVLFDVKSGIIIKRLLGHTEHVRAVVFEPQAKWLASAGDDKRIILWSLITGEKIRQWQAPGKVNALAINPDGTILASGGDDHNVNLWNSETGQLIQTFAGHTREISGLAFNSSGEWVASASYDGTVRLWDVKSGQALHVLEGHTDKVQALTFSPNGKLLATGGNDKTVRLWDTDSAKTVRIFTGHKSKVFGLRFGAEGHYLTSSSADRTLRVWDIDSGVTLRVLQGHKGRVIGITIHNGQLFSASTDGTVNRWDIALPSQYVVDLPTEPASSAIAPDSDSVAVGFADGTLRLYSIPNGQILWQQDKVHKRDVQRLAFNNNGSLLVSASLDKTAKLWQVKDGKLQQTLSGHTSGVNAVAFSPNGKTIATASYDGQIGLFTVGTEKGQFYKQAHEGEEINSVAFNANGTKLLTASDYGVRLWKVKDTSLTLLQAYPKVHNIIMWAALSPDGQRYASVGRNFLVNVYATEDGKQQYSLPGHEGSILRAAFSPDNEQIATVSGDGTVRFWDLTNGSEIFKLRLPTQSNPPAPLWDFDFRCTPKGCWLAVPLTGGKLMLYEMGHIYD